MASSVATINVRLDKTLKQAGDATLAQEGVSPSRIVRALWQRLAERGELLDTLLALLFCDARSQTQAAEQNPVEQGWALADELCRTFLPTEGVEEHGGAPCGSADAWEELYTSAMDVHFTDKGLYQ